MSEELPPLTEAEVLRRMRRDVDLQGSIAAAALMWGVSRQHVSAVLRGYRRMGSRLTKALKLKRKKYVMYRFEEDRAAR